MHIYNFLYVYNNKIYSPVNNYICKRITKQNIKQFGFNSIEELHSVYPGFSLTCIEYEKSRDTSKSKKYIKSLENKRSKSKKKIDLLKKDYEKNPLLCIKCNTPKSFDKKDNKFCSRKCANSRGPRTEDFKIRISKLNKGKRLTEETKLKLSLARGGKSKRNTLCKICNKDTNTTHRKTCSAKCKSEFSKLQSRLNPKCGGQKHTHRTKIFNIIGEFYTAESSYEVNLSTILNELNILWIRPAYFWYTDEMNNKRRYYPDFYLPDYDLYLDPKNDYLIKTDIFKIHQAAIENNIMIVIIGKESINLNAVKKLVENRGTAPLTSGCKPDVLLLN
jgi:hypothetical protein